jgi:hypothetical protein
MDYALRIVVEKVAISSQEVIKRDTITSYAIQCPTSIGELGLCHTEQIALLEKVQNILLAYHLKNPWLKSPCCSGLPAGEKTDILACSTRHVSPLEHGALCSKTLTCTASPMNRHANS